jgi:hypothetical protein
MLELDVPIKLINLAEERAKKLGVLKNSITNGEGNIAGYIGQLLIKLVLKGEDVDDYNFDVRKDNIRYEVKTKRCKFKPDSNYACSVCAHNTRQNCDYYVFVRITNDYKKAWILGKKDSKKYLKESIFCKKGEIDPDSTFGWKFKENCYNLKIKDLEPFKI